MIGKLSEDPEYYLWADMGDVLTIAKTINEIIDRLEELERSMYQRTDPRNFSPDPRDAGYRGRF